MMDGRFIVLIVLGGAVFVVALGFIGLALKHLWATRKQPKTQTVQVASNEVAVIVEDERLLAPGEHAIIDASKTVLRNYNTTMYVNFTDNHTLLMTADTAFISMVGDVLYYINDFMQWSKSTISAESIITRASYFYAQKWAVKFNAQSALKLTCNLGMTIKKNLEAFMTEHHPWISIVDVMVNPCPAVDLSVQHLMMMRAIQTQVETEKE